MRDEISFEEDQIDSKNKMSIGNLLSKISNSDNHTKVIILVISVLLVAVGGLLAAGDFFKKGSDRTDLDEEKLTNLNPVDIKIEQPGEPMDHYSPLTGELMTKTDYEKLIKRRPLVIMVENHPDARPQSGLDQADLVHEFLVEGGITRFAPVFWSKQPEVVGPVRSVRKYVLDLIATLGDPLIMHIGGATSDNPEANALAEIQKYGMKSLGVSGGQFWRVNYRQAPHNAYVNSKDLWAKAEQIGWVGPTSVYGWQFKDANPGKDNLTTKIKVNWGGAGDNDWAVKWDYNAGNNNYLRSFISGPHVDGVTQKQLEAKNVIIVYAPSQSANDGSARIVYDIFGEGKLEVFSDGKITTGTWRKPNRNSQYDFVDNNGNTIKLNRGMTWLMVVPNGSRVQY